MSQAEINLVKSAVDLAASIRGAEPSLFGTKFPLAHEVLAAFRLICKETGVDTVTERRCYQALLHMSCESEGKWTWWEKLFRIESYFRPTTSQESSNQTISFYGDNQQSSSSNIYSESGIQSHIKGQQHGSRVVGLSPTNPIDAAHWSIILNDQQKDLDFNTITASRKSARGDRNAQEREIEISPVQRLSSIDFSASPPASLLHANHQVRATNKVRFDKISSASTFDSSTAEGRAKVSDLENASTVDGLSPSAPIFGATLATPSFLQTSEKSVYTRSAPAAGADKEVLDSSSRSDIRIERQQQLEQSSPTAKLLRVHDMSSQPVSPVSTASKVVIRRYKHHSATLLRYVMRSRKMSSRHRSQIPTAQSVSPSSRLQSPSSSCPPHPRRSVDDADVDDVNIDRALAIEYSSEVGPSSVSSGRSLQQMYESVPDQSLPYLSPALSQAAATDIGSVTSTGDGLGVFEQQALYQGGGSQYSAPSVSTTAYGTHALHSAQHPLGGNMHNTVPGGGGGGAHARAHAGGGGSDGVGGLMRDARGDISRRSSDNEPAALTDDEGEAAAVADNPHIGATAIVRVLTYVPLWLHKRWLYSLPHLNATISTLFLSSEEEAPRVDLQPSIINNNFTVSKASIQKSRQHRSLTVIWYSHIAHLDNKVQSSSEKEHERWLLLRIRRAISVQLTREVFLSWRTVSGVFHGVAITGTRGMKSRAFAAFRKAIIKARRHFRTFQDIRLPFHFSVKDQTTSDSHLGCDAAIAHHGLGLSHRRLHASLISPTMDIANANDAGLESFSQSRSMYSRASISPPMQSRRGVPKSSRVKAIAEFKEALSSTTREEAFLDVKEAVSTLRLFTTALALKRWYRRAIYNRQHHQLSALKQARLLRSSWRMFRFCYNMITADLTAKRFQFLRLKRRTLYTPRIITLSARNDRRLVLEVWREMLARAARAEQTEKAMISFVQVSCVTLQLLKQRQAFYRMRACVQHKHTDELRVRLLRATMLDKPHVRLYARVIRDTIFVRAFITWQDAYRAHGMSEEDRRASDAYHSARTLSQVMQTWRYITSQASRQRMFTRGVRVHRGGDNGISLSHSILRNGQPVDFSTTSTLDPTTSTSGIFQRTWPPKGDAYELMKTTAVSVTVAKQRSPDWFVPSTQLYHSQFSHLFGATITTMHDELRMLRCARLLLRWRAFAKSTRLFFSREDVLAAQMKNTQSKRSRAKAIAARNASSCRVLHRDATRTAEYLCGYGATLSAENLAADNFLLYRKWACFYGASVFRHDPPPHPFLSSSDRMTLLVRWDRASDDVSVIHTVYLSEDLAEMSEEISAAESIIDNNIRSYFVRAQDGSLLARSSLLRIFTRRWLQRAQVSKKTSTAIKLLRARTSRAFLVDIWTQWKSVYSNITYHAKVLKSKGLSSLYFSARVSVFNREVNERVRQYRLRTAMSTLHRQQERMQRAKQWRNASFTRAARAITASISSRLSFVLSSQFITTTGNAASYASANKSRRSDEEMLPFSKTFTSDDRLGGRILLPDLLSPEHTMGYDNTRSTGPLSSRHDSATINKKRSGVSIFFSRATEVSIALAERRVTSVCIEKLSSLVSHRKEEMRAVWQLRNGNMRQVLQWLRRLASLRRRLVAVQLAWKRRIFRVLKIGAVARTSRRLQLRLSFRHLRRIQAAIRSQRFWMAKSYLSRLGDAWKRWTKSVDTLKVEDVAMRSVAASKDLTKAWLHIRHTFLAVSMHKAKARRRLLQRFRRFQQLSAKNRKSLVHVPYSFSKLVVGLRSLYLHCKSSMLIKIRGFHAQSRLRAVKKRRTLGTFLAVVADKAIDCAREQSASRQHRKFLLNGGLCALSVAAHRPPRVASLLLLSRINRDAAASATTFSTISNSMRSANAAGGVGDVSLHATIAARFLREFIASASLSCRVRYRRALVRIRGSDPTDEEYPIDLSFYSHARPSAVDGLGVALGEALGEHVSGGREWEENEVEERPRPPLRTLFPSLRSWALRRLMDSPTYAIESTELAESVVGAAAGMIITTQAVKEIKGDRRGLSPASMIALRLCAKAAAVLAVRRCGRALLRWIEEHIRVSALRALLMRKHRSLVLLQRALSIFAEGAVEARDRIVRRVIVSRYFWAVLKKSLSRTGALREICRIADEFFARRGLRLSLRRLHAIAAGRLALRRKERAVRVFKRAKSVSIVLTRLYSRTQTFTKQSQQKLKKGKRVCLTTT